MCWQSVTFQKQEQQLLQCDGGYIKFFYLEMYMYGCKCMSVRCVFAVYLRLLVYTQCSDDV